LKQTAPGDINTLQQIALTVLQAPYETAILSSHLTFIISKIKIYDLVNLSAVWRRSTQNGALFIDDIKQGTRKQIRAELPGCSRKLNKNWFENVPLDGELLRCHIRWVSGAA